MLENVYLRQKYKEFKQKTMEKSLMNEKQHKMTCMRILREISSGGSCEVTRTVLPRSNYLSASKQRPLQSSATRSSSRKRINPRMLTMYNIYHQKPPGLTHLPRLPKALLIR